MRFLRSSWTVGILVCLAPIGAAGAPAERIAEVAQAGAAASCPNVLLIESTNGKYYIAVFQAHAPTKSSIDMTFYAKSAAYSVSLAGVDVSKPISTQNYTYRSSPAVIRNPGTDELLGASVQPHLGSGNCPGENIIIPSVATLTDPDRHIDAETDALEAQLATEAASATVINTPVAATGVATPTCDTPFADASVDQLVKPVLTEDQRRDPGLLPASARVQLDASGGVLEASIESSSGNGAVDGAVLAAAKKSTYRPARFACQPERSSHVLRVDFSR